MFRFCTSVHSAERSLSSHRRNLHCCNWPSCWAFNAMQQSQHCPSSMHVNTLTVLLIVSVSSNLLESAADCTKMQHNLCHNVSNTYRQHWTESTNCILLQCWLVSRGNETICAILHRQCLFHCPHELLIDLHCMQSLAGAYNLSNVKNTGPKTKAYLKIGSIILGNKGTVTLAQDCDFLLNVFYVILGFLQINNFYGHNFLSPLVDSFKNFPKRAFAYPLLLRKELFWVCSEILCDRERRGRQSFRSIQPKATDKLNSDAHIQSRTTYFTCTHNGTGPKRTSI